MAELVCEAQAAGRGAVSGVRGEGGRVSGVPGLRKAVPTRPTAKQMWVPFRG